MNRSSGLPILSGKGDPGGVKEPASASTKREWILVWQGQRWGGIKKPEPISNSTFFQDASQPGGKQALPRPLGWEGKEEQPPVRGRGSAEV